MSPQRNPTPAGGVPRFENFGLPEQVSALFSWGNVLADFDNDGDVDLYAGTHEIDPWRFDLGPLPDFLFRSNWGTNGDGTLSFTNLSASPYLREPNPTGLDPLVLLDAGPPEKYLAQQVHGTTIADYNQDGLVDVFTTTIEVEHDIPVDSDGDGNADLILELDPVPNLYRNATTGAGSWLHIKLVGAVPTGEQGMPGTTATISGEQYKYAQKAAADAGLQDKITVLRCDYRDLQGQYDKLVSIEMIEAVGLAYLPRYFEKCAALLKDDGIMLLQAITMPDRRYEQARRSVDFIQRYIFPGGFLPCLSGMTRLAAERTDLEMIGLDDITAHYARTLADWRRRFLANTHRLRELGFPDAFIRMWEYYFCYCEGGFAERTIGCVQMLFARPGYRPAERRRLAEGAA